MLTRSFETVQEAFRLWDEGQDLSEISRALGVSHSTDLAASTNGVDWSQNNWNSLSVAKRDSVALLDTLIGPKT